MLVLVALGVAACAGPAPGTVDVTGPPLQEFRTVHEAIEPTCGTLDCHGQPGRNFQLWGFDGQRLAPPNVPENADGGGLSTDAEVEHSYRSLVGLEPEVMAAVMRDRGAHPERLTLIRKARGAEAHKGGTLMVEGDALDTCLTTWIAGTVNVNACAVAQRNAFVP